jgi:hypothetical protein
MKSFKVFLITALSVSVPLLYNNCSGVNFNASSNENAATGQNAGPTGDPDSDTPINPPDIPTIIRNCNDAAAAGTLSTMNQNIAFEDTDVDSGRPNNVCEFGSGDNLDQLDGYMQARYEQEQRLNLPAKAVICDLEMTAARQSIKYDDIFFLTFNGRILASDNQSSISHRLSPEFTMNLSSGQSVPIYKFDWLSIRGHDFQNDHADDYCLGLGQGAADCEWPLTEQTGDIVLRFDPELLIAIGSKAPATQQRFGFIMTGDNNPADDCYHSRIEFSMKVKYYLAP